MTQGAGRMSFQATLIDNISLRAHDQAESFDNDFGIQHLA